MKNAELGTKRKLRWNELPCPSCGVKRALIKIVYGMPTPDFDYSKYISGGCCMDLDSPDYSCKTCDWQGQKEDLPNYVPIVRVSKKPKPNVVKMKKKAAVRKVKILRHPRSKDRKEIKRKGRDIET